MLVRERGELVRGQRGAAPIALEAMAIAGNQEVELGLGRHAFGDHAQFQAAGKTDRRERRRDWGNPS